MSFKIFVALAAAATIPLGAGAVFARTQLRKQHEAAFASRLEGITRNVEAEYQRITKTDRRLLARLCAKDLLVDRTLLDLAADRFDAQAAAELSALLPDLRESLDLDVLDVLDANGRILGSGHFPGRRGGASERRLAQVAKRAPAYPFVRTWRVRGEAGGRDVLALTSTCVATRDDATVVVAGGRIVSESFVARFQVPGIVTVALAGPDGALPSQLRDRFARQPSRAVPLLDVDGQRVATLVALVPDDTLRDALAELDRSLLAALAAGLVGAWLLAFIVGRRLSNPLAELEQTALRVAAGDLDATVHATAGGEVGRVVAAFNRMTSELKGTREKLLRAERIAAWRDIARRIAHEIKNPLFPIQTSIETMRKTYKTRHPDFDEIFEESTTTILEEVERMKRIVSEFSSFARMPKPKPDALDVVEVADHVVSLHASDPDVAIRLEGDERVVVRADRAQLTQVLVNLVQNASDAARDKHPSGGAEVVVGVTATPSPNATRANAPPAAVIRVSDNGAGIADENRHRVFEPYFTSKTKGTGLGLAIVHRIVGDHGGNIEVRRSAAGGAEMVVTLPPEGPPAEADASVTDGVSPIARR
ncbi:MAG: HAMP domain-containing protein [Deltaproteobacteria bacterium]|nr:HAMP domain-containing protein [Deltaproteobacteria bacterium]